MKRAVVLGSGGTLGTVWEIGVAAGLLDCGLDLRDADLFVGTSAGSTVSAQLAHGHDPRTLFEGLQSAPERRVTSERRGDPDHTAATFRLWSSFERMTRDARAQVGRMALEADTVDEEVWVGSFADGKFPGWPTKPMLVLAVACETGEVAVFDAASGVPIERALAASCSVPALFPPVSIDGARYTDGGVASPTSADLAARIEPDVVLIVAPIGSLDRGIHVVASRDIERERAALEDGGAQVRVVLFDETTKELVGPNLMDATRRLPVAEAGRSQGARIAAELLEVWQ